MEFNIQVNKNDFKIAIKIFKNWWEIVKNEIK